ncbi:hypothetical protein ACJRO7_000215 [Eucalyptus globulus]|uniref:DUF4220 domain-containing protein n=1 Tax=Eucalyptus globulus TaxID=34317 RepID=A0ABD3LS82_EUCGL
MADWVAAFTVGLISHNRGNSSAHVVEVDEGLQAFWASFLLLHLGGPDTIIAFSLEDSSLWPWHLLSLIFEVYIDIYVFVQIFPSDKSMVIPLILVFLAGVIKIAERTLALYLLSLPRVKESTLLEKELRMAVDSQLLEELNVLGDGHGCSDEERAKLDESIMIKHAYSLFQIFKGFIVDLIFTRQQREMSREYFAKVSTIDALRVISVELDFIYEKLHTKALTIHHKWSYIFRIITCTSVVVALGQFNRLKKYGLPKLDVKITHFLLFGGIILDGIALLMLVFSNWTIARIKYNTTGSSKLDLFLHKLVSTMDYLRKPRYAACEVESYTNITYEVLYTPLIFRRWSESISACNIFSEALKESPRKICKYNQFWGIIIIKNICSLPFQMVDKIISCVHQAGQTIERFCGKRSMIADAKYVLKNPFLKKLWIIIFNKVKEGSRKLDDPETVRQIVKSSGNLFFPHKSWTRNLDEVLENITKANFHIHVIRLHIATEIWYNIEISIGRNDEREFSKILSDYMLYILLNRPNVMSTVVAVDIAQMISSEMLRELQDRIISDVTKDPEGMCKKLYNTIRNPYSTKGGAWRGMLLYAAVNIKGEAHVQVLSKGGELLTFIWLLMAHFGCFYKPEWGLCYEFWDEFERSEYLRSQSTE